MGQTESVESSTLQREQPALLPARLRLHLAIKRLVLLGATLGILVLGLEAVTRLLSDIPEPLMLRDSLVGQRFIRSFEGMVYNEEAGRAVLLRFNREGLRGPDRPYEKPEGVGRIAILGDSMVASVGVEEEQTMVAQLERLLNRSSGGLRWEVLNFGVSGASTGQEMVLYREVASRYHPDIILCAFFVGNDLSDNSPRLSNNPRIYFDTDASGKLVQLPFSTERALLSRWLNRHSRFYVWQKQAFNKARHQVSSAAGAISSGDWIFCSKQSEEIVHAWDLTGALLRQFRQEVESRGSLFVVVLVPSAVQICNDRLEQVTANAGDMAASFDQDYPNRRLAEICTRAGIPLWALTEDFRRAAPSADSRVEREWLFFNGAGHFNERGSRVAAESLLRFLTEGALQQVAGSPPISRAH